MINNKFNIGDKVKINPLDLRGRVISIWMNKTGLMYEVRYFWDAKKNEVYFYADELCKE